jgi:purine-nucleoside phosphorylase
MLSTHSTASIYDILQTHYGAYFQAIRQRISEEVDGLVISGSGLNTVLEKYPAREVIHTSEIAGFPKPSVIGHSSVLRVIEIEGKTLAHFTGRCHLYEGFSMHEALAQIGVGALLGARFAILTNSAGGLNPLFQAGDIMLIADTLNLMFRSVQRGWLYEAKRSPLVVGSGSQILSASWRAAICAALTANAIAYKEGTYIAVTGPSYETPAEARMYRFLGGSAIGMSTIHEAEFASLCGMQVAACSLVTNTLPESLPVTVSHEEVVEAARLGAAKMAEFVRAASATVSV